MTDDDIIRLAGNFAQYPAKWFETLKVCDLVADKESGDVAMIISVTKQRHMKAPDMFRLEFSDGSYIHASDNELSAQYRPYVLVGQIVADEREACAQICEQFADQDSGPDGIVLDYHAHLIRARGNK